MSDQVGTIAPSTASWAHVESVPLGGSGLGCSSNTRIVACTYRGDPGQQPNLVVYDADGQRIWADAGQMGTTALLSAPIVGSDGTVIAADQNWVMRVDPIANKVLWQTHKPDTGLPISPVLVGSDLSMVFIASDIDVNGEPAEVSVWDAATGALLAHQPLVDTTNGRTYITRNTVAVRGNRAYILAAAVSDPTDGRLIAVDVCEGQVCGARGSMTVAWHFDFKGPSGASPLLIGNTLYFDGRPSKSKGIFYAVADNGKVPRRVWKRSFNSPFGVSAAQDPRGGMWVHLSRDSGALLRLNQDTGATDQRIDVSSVLGQPAGYVAQSVVSVSTSASGSVVLTIGAQMPKNPLPSFVTAIDVSSTPDGTALWTYPVAANAADNSAAGQFPVVISATGARRVVFNGMKSSTFFVGEP